MTSHSLESLGIGVGGFSTSASSSITSTSSSTSSVLTIQEGIRRRYLQSSLIDFLRSHRGFHSFSALRGPPLSIDLEAKENAVLLEDVTKNAKVSVDSSLGVIAYLPHYPFIKSPIDIVKFLKTKEFGDSEELIIDSYEAAADDVKILVAEGKIHRIVGDERKADSVMLYYRDNTLEMLETSLGAHFIQLWREVKLPSTVAELDDTLIKNGLLNADQLKMIAADKARRQREELKRKRAATQRKPRKRYKQKVTNQHLVEQFDFLQDEKRLLTNPHNQKH